MTPQTDKYWMSRDAIVISPNANNKATDVRVNIMNGTVIKVLWPEAAFSIHTNYSELDETLRNNLVQDAQSMLGYSATNGYRTWVVEAMNTRLASEVLPYYIYVRLNTNGEALLVFSPDEEKLIELDVDTDDDGNVTDADIKYVWVCVGSLSAPTSEGGTVIADRVCEYKSGLLGTEQGVDESIKQNQWYELDENNKQISMQDGWSFATMVANIVKAATYRLRGRHLIDNDIKWYDETGILVSTDTTTTDADAASADKDSTLVTSGWVFGPLLTWLRGKFVRKDAATTEEMTGGLKTNESLEAVKNITAGGKTTTNTLETTSSATIGGDLTATNGTTTASSITTTTGTSSSHDETIGGKGAAVYEDANKEGHVVTDSLYVRKAAWFRSLTIEDVKHVGGELILSQAACQIGRVKKLGEGPHHEVVELEDNAADSRVKAYRCYFPTEANGKKQYNEWAVNDQARCQVCNLSSGTSQNVATKYYWRLVTKVHSATGDETEHYIDLSNTDFDGADSLPVGTTDNVSNASAVPEADDSIVLFGHRNPEADGLYSRTSAQIFSTAETNAPSRRYYHSITSYDLSSCAVETMEWDATTRFPHWRVGNDDGYIDFSDQGLNIRASRLKFVTTGGTEKDVSEAIDEVKNDAQQIVEDALAAGFTIHEQTASESFTYPTPNDYDPDGDESYPYMSVVKDAYTASLTLSEEVGNYFLTTHGFLFCLVAKDGAFYWHIVTDKYLIAATQKAAEAQTAADNAKQVADDCASDTKVTPAEKLKLLDTRNSIISEYNVLISNYGYLSNNIEGFPNDSQLTKKNELASLFSRLNTSLSSILKGSKTVTDGLNATDEDKANWAAVVDWNPAITALLDSYRKAFKELSNECSTGSNGIFEQTNEMTKIGNQYFKKNADGTYTVSEGGLVTKAGYADLFASEVTSQGVAKRADVETLVEDGISKVKITADKIDLTGETTVKGMLRRGNVTFTSADIDNNVFCECHPNNPFFRMIQTINYNDHKEVILSKLGNYTTLPQCGETGIVFCMPYFDLGATDNETGSTDLSRSWLSRTIENLAHDCGYNDNKGIPNVNLAYADDHFRTMVNSWKSQLIHDARTWVGMDIILYIPQGAGAYSFVNVEVGEDVYYPEKEDATADLYDVDARYYSKLVRLSCKHEFIKEEYGTLVKERVYWTLEEANQLCTNDIISGTASYDINKIELPEYEP